MPLLSPTVSVDSATNLACLGIMTCSVSGGGPRSLYCRVWFPQKHLRLLVCPSRKEVKHGLSLLQHEIVGMEEQRWRRMWSGDPPVRTSKQRGSGGSIRQTRPDKPGPGLCYNHCLLCRHTTDPQSLPSKSVPEMEKDEREKGRKQEKTMSGHQSKLEL